MSGPIDLITIVDSAESKPQREKSFQVKAKPLLNFQKNIISSPFPANKAVKLACIGVILYLPYYAAIFCMANKHIRVL